jgi:hypothetical protein
MNADILDWRNTMSKNSAGKAGDQPSKTSRTKSKNALIHGIYSRDVILSFESREDFETLLSDLRDEWRPDGCIENEVVFHVAQLRWQKRRLVKTGHAAANADPFIGES